MTETEQQAVVDWLKTAKFKLHHVSALDPDDKSMWTWERDNVFIGLPAATFFYRTHQAQVAEALTKSEQKVTFDSTAGEWQGDEHVRPVFAIQGGKIIRTWYVSDDLLRRRYGVSGAVITQEHIEKYGSDQLNPQKPKGETK